MHKYLYIYISHMHILQRFFQRSKREKPIVDADDEPAGEPEEEIQPVCLAKGHARAAEYVPMQ